MSVAVLVLGRQPNEIAGRILLFVVALAAVIGLVYTPYDPLAVNWQHSLAQPSLQHWFGTDLFGRDVLSRSLAALALSIGIGAVATLLALLFGGMLGAAGGYFGGPADKLVAIFMDALLAFPGTLLALGLIAALGPSGGSIIIALSLAYAPSVYRLVRGHVLSIKEKEYVEASRALGNSELYTIVRHVLPNCASTVLVVGASVLGSSILAESALSFLGLGVSPPTPTLGGMLAEGRQYVGTAPWISIFPGIAISLLLFGINLSADALRDRFDPRSR